MPVQRIPRYQLLLVELQKRTPKNHPDYPFIEVLVPFLFISSRKL